MNDKPLLSVLTTLVIVACIVGLVVAVQHTQRGDTEDGATVSGPVSKTVVELLAPNRRAACCRRRNC